MKRLTILMALVPAMVSAEPLPFLVGGDYALTNQHGDTYTQVDPDGRTQLLFFGYANCLQICSSVLPQMADITQPTMRFRSRKSFCSRTQNTVRSTRMAALCIFLMRKARR